MPDEERWGAHQFAPLRPSRDNLHTLAGSGRPLGVICSKCGRRSMLAPETVGAHSGNMKDICTLRLRCTACDSRQWTHRLFVNDTQLAVFEAGA